MDSINHPFSPGGYHQCSHLEDVTSRNFAVLPRLGFMAYRRQGKPQLSVA